MVRWPEQFLTPHFIFTDREGMVSRRQHAEALELECLWTVAKGDTEANGAPKCAGVSPETWRSAAVLDPGGLEGAPLRAAENRGRSRFSLIFVIGSNVRRRYSR